MQKSERTYIAQFVHLYCRAAPPVPPMKGVLINKRALKNQLGSRELLRV